MMEPKIKRAGAYSPEQVNNLRRHSRKFGFYPSREHVWHLLDTVEERDNRITELEAKLQRYRDYFGLLAEDQK